MKILGVIFLFIFGILFFFYILGGKPDGQTSPSSYSNSFNNDNFDGSYSIRFDSSISCGEYGYQFKLMHERDGYSSTSAMRKSNCKMLSNGAMSGYIYPKRAPNLRIFWIARNGSLSYLD